MHKERGERKIYKYTADWNKVLNAQFKLISFLIKKNYEIIKI